MRRMHVIVALSLLLLFVPIYLWKVQGITFFSGEPSAPAEPYDASKDAPHDDIVELLRQSLITYNQSGVKGYTCTFVMHERVNGKLKKPEVIECWFQEKQIEFSVLMVWKEGADKAAASLYVEGANDGMMCVRPADPVVKKIFGTVNKKVDCDEAKASARYPIKEFGVRCGTERTYKAWKALKERGVKLHIEDLGVQKIAELDGRECRVIRRYCNPPEEEGMTDITVYLDVETMMQVGSILKAGDQLIGEYYFKNIVINPKFDENQFKPEILKKY
jgi:Protein of unknown function (DUF1571)